MKVAEELKGLSRSIAFLKDVQAATVAKMEMSTSLYGCPRKVGDLIDCGNGDIYEVMEIRVVPSRKQDGIYFWEIRTRNTQLPHGWRMYTEKVV